MPALINTFDSRHLGLSVAVCLYVFSTNLVLAQQPSTSSDEQLSEATGVADEARALEISRELAARESAIENMQSELGIYDAALIEAYADFANFYRQLEDYASAISLYSEALQIARINTGLYSEQQFPIIEALIDNNGKLEEWRAVDDLQQLNYHISSRVFAVSDSQYLIAADDFGDWKLRVIRENLLDQSGRGLLNTAEDLSDFYERIIDSAELHSDIKPESLLVMIYGKSQADLTLARSTAAMPYTAFEGTVSRYVNQTRCQTVTNSRGQVVRQCYTVQVENPRYRQSQRDAKQMFLSRYTRQISNSIARLRLIKDTSSELSNGERQRLEIQIAELQTESEQLLRAARRMTLF